MKRLLQFIGTLEPEIQQVFGAQMWRGPKTTPSTWGSPLSGHSFPEAYWLPSFLHPFPSYSSAFISKPSLVWRTKYVTAHLCPEKTSQKQPQRLLLWVQNQYKLLSPACASRVNLIREKTLCCFSLKCLFKHFESYCIITTLFHRWWILAQLLLNWVVLTPTSPCSSKDSVHHLTPRTSEHLPERKAP